MSIRLSVQGLEIADQARKSKRWNRQDDRLAEAALVSGATLKRFWRQEAIREDSFEQICKALSLENWERLVEEVQEERSLSFTRFAFDENWVGREAMVQRLTERLQNSCRVLLLAGMTGIGKTALAEKLLQELQPLPQICRVNLDYPETTDFTSVAVSLLESWNQTVSAEDARDSSRLLNWLTSYLQQNFCLLVIDSLEIILKGNESTGWSDFHDPLWLQFFQALLAADTCVSKVLLTSQDSPAQLEELSSRYAQFYHCQVLDGLAEAEQMALFERIGLSMQPSHEAYLRRMGHAYEGHPLALRVIAGEISQSPFNGDVSLYWQQYGDEISRVEAIQQQPDVEGGEDALRLAQYSRSLRKRVGRHIERAFQRLSQDLPLSYVLLCMGAVYRRPVPEAFWLRMLEGRSLTDSQRWAVLDALYDRHLAEGVPVAGDFLIRQHNLIRSVALMHLKHLRP